MSNEKQILEERVKQLQASLKEAQEKLTLFLERAENNIYNNLKDALNTIENNLRNKAFQDCEGAYNVGSDMYSQEFIVDTIKYRATLTCLYNRHDKTYYYLDESEFKYEKVGVE